MIVLRSTHRAAMARVTAERDEARRTAELLDDSVKALRIRAMGQAEQIAAMRGVVDAQDAVIADLRAKLVLPRGARGRFARRAS